MLFDIYQGVVNVAGSDSVIFIGESTLTASEQSGLLVLAGLPQAKIE
ncbi:hypothetical protein NX722_02455 [Endozoicomonas gorgoniicola]|uniref:Uncharacterized protein n=1 Tax=Endozoicomonas gorgoniicola TaxID=1234144 RepID=A0ABT3MQ86_9GAMM|nr:hypothetical protein [Endozoicomonas gorgoniicola]MCW7551522.1 hypothetical protein [Endozoicomonas gorgoniicola]